MICGPCEQNTSDRGGEHRLVATIASLPLTGEDHKGELPRGGLDAAAVLEQLIRDARSLLDEKAAVPAIVVRMECLDCDGDIDPGTRMHDTGEPLDPDCPHATVVVPDNCTGVTLHCPHCDSRDLYEVNVGEVWDEIQGATLTGGALLVDVHQDESMDREGDGYACGGCRSRLAEPGFASVEFEYLG